MTHTIPRVASLNPTFFDLSENWHNDSFSQKKNSQIFYFSQKVPFKKTTGLPTFRFPGFFHRKNKWVRWNGILLMKIQKLKNTSTTI
jgi:hypothetical protein